jgi:hypothetical protein
MTMNDERESFGAALHEAALSFEPPSGELLYQSAVRRGRRLRRRRTAGTSLAGALALGVAATLAFVLSGVGADAPPPNPSPAATQVPKDLPKYMLTTFQSLLPAGTTVDKVSGMLTATGYGYGMRSNLGGWQAGAQEMAFYNGGQITLELSVARQQGVATDCETGFDMADCKEMTVGQGQLVIIKTGNGTSQPYAWEYLMNYAGGKSVQLQADPNLNIKNPQDPFSTAQVERLLGAAAWDPVLAGLPALVKCPAMEPATGKYKNEDWICPTTGKLYPIMGQMYAPPQ